MHYKRVRWLTVENILTPIVGFGIGVAINFAAHPADRISAGIIGALFALPIWKWLKKP